MKEYDLYVPLFDNAGRPIDPTKLSQLKKRLIEHFGGLTHFPQENEGFWKLGRVTFRDKIVILRVLSNEPRKAQELFKQIKSEMMIEWGQTDVLIVARDVNLL
jgi:hypothetical protein